MNGTVAIRRIMKQYVSKWCNKTGKHFAFDKNGKNYEQFLEDSKQMFSIILDRIQKETEGLYPLVRRLQDDQRRVA